MTLLCYTAAISHILGLPVLIYQLSSIYSQIVDVNTEEVGDALELSCSNEIRHKPIMFSTRSDSLIETSGQYYANSRS